MAEHNDEPAHARAPRVSENDRRRDRRLQHRRQSRAQAQTAAPAVRRGPISGPPDRNAVDSYIAIHADNTATLYAGYVELGQGGPTALLQIAAEELDLDFEQMKIATVDTHVSTEGLTLASRTAAIGGTETRAAAAEARRVLLELAAERLDASRRRSHDRERSRVRRAATLRAPSLMPSSSATSHSSGHSSSTPTTAASSCRARTPTTPYPRRATPTTSWALACRGPTSPRRSPAPTNTFTTSVCPECCTAAWSGRAGKARTASATRRSRASTSRRSPSIPGVQIVRRNNFVGVVAEREWDAVRAASQLKVTWQPFAAALPGHEGLFDSFKAAKTNDLIDTDAGDVDAALARAAHVVSAAYRGPYQSHGAMAPNCAVADVTSDAALVICSSQAVFLTRFGLAPLLGLPLDKIRVQYAAGSNTYGNSCYGEAANAAAILSQEVGRPVRLQLSRADELGWDNYGPALLSEVRAAVDADGKLVALDYQAWSHATAWLETASQLALGQPPPTSGFGVPAPGPGGAGLFSVHLSQTDMYDVPNRRIVNHVVTGAGYLRTGALRAPMDPSTFFALEGVLDELAHAAKLDPYELRKRNISDPRWLAVLDAAAERREVDTARRGLAAFERESRHGPRYRRRHAPPTAEPGRSRDVCGGRRRHRGEQGHRRRRREARSTARWTAGWPSIPESSRARSSACACTARASRSARKCSSTRPTSRASTGRRIGRCASASTRTSRRF